MATTARDYALAEVDRVALPGWEPGLIRRRTQPPADPRDLALAEQIRIGVIKYHLLLEHLIQQFATHPGRIDPLVRKILGIGLYQLKFLSRIPASAIVNEAVEQARRFGRPHAAGSVNAILRSATREAQVPLPDPKVEPEEYARVVLSHPPELFRRLSQLLGNERAIQFCEHDNAEPPTLVRSLRNAQFPPPALSEGGIRITPHQKAGIYVVQGARRATFADWAARGLAQVQDATSAAVIEKLDIQPGHDILDRCAGLGTKTIQIYERLGGTGWIMATDPSEFRCDALRSLAQSREIGNIAVIQASMLQQISEIRPPAFDRMLIDVPCSNSGVLARRAEARYTQTQDALASLTRLQDQILDDSASYLRPDGLMVYSTCSVWPEENEQRMAQFLQRHPEYTRLNEELTLPSLDSDPKHYHDGGYCAVLKRVGR